MKIKKLVIHEAESKIVQYIFKRFVKIGSGTELVKDLNEKGYKTKKRQLKNGGHQGDKPFTKGSLYKILNNVTYLGKVEHKGEVYDGVHEAIIDQRLWDQVQSILAKNYRGRSNHTRMKTPALLKGLLFTKDGHAMSPSHNRKNGKLYRYYLTAKAAKLSHEECDLRQIPAGEIEEIAINQIHEILRSPEMIMRTQQATEIDAHEQEIMKALRQLEPVWMQLFPTEQARIIQLLIEKIIVDTDGIDFYIRLNGLTSLATEVDDQIIDPSQEDSEKTYHTHVSITLKRRDGRKCIVVPDDDEFTPVQTPKPLTGIQKILIQAHRWQGWLDEGKYSSSVQIAKKEKVDPRYVQRVLKYAILAPDLVESILHDQVPDGLATRHLTGNIPAKWNEQRKILEDLTMLKGPLGCRIAQ